MNSKTLTRGIAFCAAGLALAFTAIAEEPTMDVFTKLRSWDITVREAGVSEIMAKRKETIQKCEEIIREYIMQNDRKGTVATAILLLGKLRSQQSVPLLVEHLTFEVFYKNTKRPQTMEDVYPSVKALIEIGIPSVDPILDKAKRTQDDKVMQCSSKVLRKILGDDIARVYVERRIAKDTGVTETEGLSRILKALQQ